MRKRAVTAATDIAFFIIGCLIYSASVRLFISSNEISPGGFTGFATLANYIWSVPTGVAVFILNIPIIILGFIKLGGVFVIKTAVATAFLSISLDIVQSILPPVITDKILAAVFGGIMAGLGLSLVLLRGGTTGGVDIIAKLINQKFRHLTVGRLILIVDAIVIALAAVVYKNIETALYSIISIYASSAVTDAVLYGADKGKIVYAITDRADEICTQVTNQLHRGITRITATGGFTGEERNLLICSLRRHEVFALQDIIFKCDSRAFVVVSDAGQIMGEGFKPGNL